MKFKISEEAIRCAKEIEDARKSGNEFADAGIIQRAFNDHARYVYDETDRWYKRDGLRLIPVPTDKVPQEYVDQKVAREGEVSGG